MILCTNDQSLSVRNVVGALGGEVVIRGEPILIPLFEPEASPLMRVCQYKQRNDFV